MLWESHFFISLLDDTHRNGRNSSGKVMTVSSSPCSSPPLLPVVAAASSAHGRGQPGADLSEFCWLLLAALLGHLSQISHCLSAPTSPFPGSGDGVEIMKNPRDETRPSHVWNLFSSFFCPVNVTDTKGGTRKRLEVLQPRGLGNLCHHLPITLELGLFFVPGVESKSPTECRTTSSVFWVRTRRGGVPSPATPRSSWAVRWVPALLPQDCEGWGLGVCMLTSSHVTSVPPEI